MPPLEALPTPVEEVLRRGVQSLISFTSSHPAETPRLSAWVRLAPGVPGAACCSALAMASVHSAFGFGVMP